MILILEDNIYKLQKVFDNHYLRWPTKTVCICAYELEAIRLSKGNVIEELYLDHELPPGAGNGLSFLRTLTKDTVRKVFSITYSQEARREMQTYCRDNGIPYEHIRL